MCFFCSGVHVSRLVEQRDVPSGFSSHMAAKTIISIEKPTICEQPLPDSYEGHVYAPSRVPSGDKHVNKHVLEGRQ